MTTERPSKSAKKRQAQMIRAMVDELVAVKPQHLASLVSDEDALRAIREAQAITSHGALRRQKQYVARLLREKDAEAIRQALDQLAGDPAREKRHFKAAEKLRDGLLTANPQARIEMLSAQDLSDAAPLLAALKTYDQATTDQQRKSAARDVFRCVHASLNAHPVD